MKENRILRFIGFMLVLFCMLIFSVSAFVIDQPYNPVTIQLNQALLGNISEGQTLHYTPSNASTLNDILRITTSQANVSLNFDTDLELQIGNYATYQIVVEVSDTIPVGSEFNSGDIVATLTLANPDTPLGIVLDTLGDWTFDFKITTTANSVNVDQGTTVTINASIDSNFA